MAHAIENRNGQDCMFYVGETPWHGLGTKVESDITIGDAIIAAGLDWEVETVETMTVDGQPVPMRLAVRRSDDKRILGSVGPRYTPLQNRTAFDFFQPFLDAGEASLHTAGSLHEGEKIWVLSKINRDNTEIVKGDEVAKFMLLSNSHDGTTAIRVGFTPIRVVCANTMAQAHCSADSKLIRIRHTRNSQVNLERIRDTMDAINASFETHAEQFKFLASRDFNQKDVNKYVRILLDVDKKPEEEIKTRTRNTIDEIMSLIEGPRQSMEGVRGTWWAAYNGYNEYLNYKQGRNADNRMASLWLGTNANENANALELAMEFANAI